MDEKEIGKKIRMLREEAGIRQTDLAEKIGISRQLLYNYESGKLKHVPKETIEKIAFVLHVTPAEIVGWEEVANNIRGMFIKTYDDLDEDDQALAFKFLMSLAANRKYDYIAKVEQGGKHGS